MKSASSLDSADFAVDCHFHIIDHRRFPFEPGVGYTPKLDESGTAQEFDECMQAHGITHGLAVQPSGYGFDNSALLDALARLQGRLKGIATVAPTVSDAQLTRLADAGVVGVRFNLIDFDAGGLLRSQARRLLERINAMHWFAELQCRAAGFQELSGVLRQSGVRLLIDHLGRPDPRLGLHEPGFREILSLADRGRSVVKLSGAFRASKQPFPYGDMDPCVEAILHAYTVENCIWGSDWPFINLSLKPSYEQTLACLKRWLPAEDQRRIVLWETPARLFGFRL